MAINRRTVLTGAALAPFVPGVAVAGTQDVNRFNQLISQIDVAEKELREMIEVHKYGQHFSWTNAASTPIEDVRGALRMFEKLFGVKAEHVKLTLPPETFETLCDHPDLLDRVRYGYGQKFSYYENRPSVERMGEAIANMFGVRIEVKSVKSFEITEIDTGAVKTLWFEKEDGVFLHHFNWDEYYNRLKVA